MIDGAPPGVQADKSRSDQLSAALSRFPHLASALPRSWVSAQARAEALDCDHTLAWWLYNEELAGHLLDAINHVVARWSAAAVPGTRSRLKRLSTNAQGFHETLIELFFGAWLIECGYEFRLPTSGADFVLGIDRDDYHLEVTALRRSPWLDPLRERLHLLSILFGYCGKMRYTRTTPPALTETAYRRIVHEVRNTLSAAASASVSSTIVQDYREFGFTLSWRRSRQPEFNASSDDLHSNAQHGAELVLEAAQGKATQLPRDRACGVLVDVSNDEGLHANAFLDRFRGGDRNLDWSAVPPHVKHVFVYATSFDRIGPWTSALLVNPFSSLPDPSGFEEFRLAVFPDKVSAGIDGGRFDAAIDQILAEIEAEQDQD